MVSHADLPRFPFLREAQWRKDPQPIPERFRLRCEGRGLIKYSWILPMRRRREFFLLRRFSRAGIQEGFSRVILIYINFHFIYVVNL